MVSQKHRLTDLVIHLAENRRLPDPLIRVGMRRLLRQRLRDINEAVGGDFAGYSSTFLEQLQQSHIAEQTDAANEQHYEVPDDFFFESLGARLKYSSCYYPEERTTLDEAEEHMLSLYSERAELQDGQHVLELGCGWGSLTIWMLEAFPNLKVTAVSNSHTQRAAILERANLRGLAERLNVITATSTN